MDALFEPLGLEVDIPYFLVEQGIFCELQALGQIDQALIILHVALQNHRGVVQMRQLSHLYGRSLFHDLHRGIVVAIDALNNPRVKLMAQGFFLFAP